MPEEKTCSTCVKRLTYQSLRFVSSLQIELHGEVSMIFFVRGQVGAEMNCDTPFRIEGCRKIPTVFENGAGTDQKSKSPTRRHYGLFDEVHWVEIQRSNHSLFDGRISEQLKCKVTHSTTRAKNIAQLMLKTINAVNLPSIYGAVVTWRNSNTTEDSVNLDEDVRPLTRNESLECVIQHRRLFATGRSKNLSMEQKL